MPQAIPINRNAPSAASSGEDAVHAKKQVPLFFIYHLSLLIGFAVAALGTAQLLFPTIVNFFTGFGDNLSSNTIGAQWLLIGTALTFSALFQYRKGTVFSGFILLILAASAVISHFVNDRMDLSMLLHLVLALVALLVCAAPRSSEHSALLPSN